MSKPIISVHELGKRYRLGATHQSHTYKAMRDLITDAFKAPFRMFTKNRSNNDDGGPKYFWALRDVSFEVQPGEAVGIIGRNGAGKTTLLKILSHITEPTEGETRCRGRIASLLEVGTGFHPELTGRENIFMNGAILGMTRVEIKNKFDEIVHFAEVEKFIDTPVKRYSSGMYVRLAFAIAAHLEPEILLIDEVLAVGDMAFQKKCMGKMGDVAKGGRTVLFVSHNMGAITRLCKRVLWLDEGKKVEEGPSSEVVNNYQSQFLQARPEWERDNPEQENIDFAFQKVSVKNSEGRLSDIFNGNEPVTVEIQYMVQRTLLGCQIGIRVYNSDGLVVLTTADSDSHGVSALSKEPGRYRAKFIIPGNFLSPGTYYLLVAAHLPNRNKYEAIEQAVVFEITPSGSLSSLDGRLGVVAPLLSWETSRDKLL